MLRTYRDEAIVLKTQKLGEADRIVTFLTKNHGQVRAVAKGIRKTSSKFGARLEPFGVVDIQFYKGRSLDIVTQVVTISALGSLIAADFDLFTHGSVIAETAEQLSEEATESVHAQFLLLLGALYALAYRRREPNHVLCSYLLRGLAIAGWAPSCYNCATCGTGGPHQSFSIPNGGSVCEDCRPTGSVTLSVEQVTLLGCLLSGDWEGVRMIPATGLYGITRLVTGYAQWHLERRIRSLQVMDRSKAG